MISIPNIKYRDFLNSNTASSAPHRFRTRARAKAMAEETDARFERLEKESQESRAQMTEMMELIRTLIKDKASASGPNPQMRLHNPIKKGKMSFIHQGTLPHMLLTSTWHKLHQCHKLEVSRMAMLLPRHG